MKVRLLVDRVRLAVPERIVILVVLSWFAVFVATRLVLFFGSMHEWAGTVSLLDIGRVFVNGLLFDSVFLLYAASVLSLLLLVMPRTLWQRSNAGLVLNASLFGLFYVMVFIAFSEWFFWEEFGARFNFIAVDYLVYSDEVIGNIRESYPLPLLLAIIAVIACAMVWLLQGGVQPIVSSRQSQTRLQSMPAVCGLLVLSVVASASVGQSVLGGVHNAYLRELGANGPYQFFAAFRNNVLDYDQFYATQPDSDVARVLRHELDEPQAHFVGEDPMDIRRVIDNPAPLHKLNVVLVTIESLSAKYLGSFGDERNLTPHLDALRQQSLFFNNAYATGTRTDRGLEAITLSIPPTPGRSIVKRIGHESGYASLGQQLTAIGYDSVFVYGGRGYFDNMNAFFSGNGYRVVDQSSVPEADIHFKNAWGMADEDLYQKTLQLADEDFAKGQPFLLQLMTTSNHRPYTYPEGRVDIPSGDGREGAVKYTDYAIHEFLTAARTRPWFDDTVFIFIADHCAGSAGSEDLPVANYHIPLWVYSPKWIKPQEFAGLTSQIDLAPTLLALLGVDYESTFFGRNALAPMQSAPRVLLGNYQHLGLFDGKDLAILSPGKQMRKHLDALGKSEEVLSGHADPLMLRDVAYYQGASYVLKNAGMAWRAPQQHDGVMQLAAPARVVPHRVL